MSSININEAIQKIKSAGSTSVRSVPMANESADGGNYQVEIQINGTWTPIISGVKQPMAEDIIRQAFNKVILG